MRKVIGLFGGRAAGKDSVANVLVEYYGFRQISFAEPMYQEVSKAFDVTIDFLQNRTTKESPLPELALRNCQDLRFVMTVLNEQGVPPTAQHMDCPRSPREIMQTWGTEYRRRQRGDDYWVRQAEMVIEADPCKNFCVSDVRFISEAKMLRECNAKLIRVTRGDQEVHDARNAHASEQEMRAFEADLDIYNQGTLEDLKNMVDEAMVSLFPEKKKKLRRAFAR